MVKKALSIAAAVVISSCSLLFGNVSAAYISPDMTPRYYYTYSYNSELSFSGSTATCKSKATGYINTTTQIDFDQTLQKLNYLGGWSSVDNAHWTDTVYYYKGSVTNSKSSLSGGTYRLKTEFTVYAGADYETIIDYSSEETV